MPRKNNKDNIEVYGNELKTSYLRSLVAEKIMKGQDKNTIINWLMDTYKMPFKTAVSTHRQGYTWIFLTCEATKEEVRKMSLARLEELYQKAEKDAALAGKDYYATLFKNINLTNKSAGLYDNNDQNEEKSGDINFNLNIGSNTVETNYEEVNDDTDEE